MLLVDTHLTIVTGVDVHTTTVPPYNPIHPYVGMVIDPADYIPFLGTNVTVNGLKRGVSDTSGILFTMSHIPLAGAFAMAPVIGHESMNFYSSKSVFADGSRLSPKGYMVMTCNDTGLPCPPRRERTRPARKSSSPPCSPPHPTPCLRPPANRYLSAAHTFRTSAVRLWDSCPASDSVPC